MEEKERGLWLPIKCESGTPPPRENGPRPQERAPSVLRPACRARGRRCHGHMRREGCGG